jgi:hypothetical protein
MGCPNMVCRAAAETPNAQACRRAGVQPAWGYKGVARTVAARGYTGVAR